MKAYQKKTRHTNVERFRLRMTARNGARVDILFETFHPHAHPLDQGSSDSRLHLDCMRQISGSEADHHTKNRLVTRPMGVQPCRGISFALDSYELRTIDMRALSRRSILSTRQIDMQY